MFEVIWKVKRKVWYGMMGGKEGIESVRRLDRVLLAKSIELPLKRLHEIESNYNRS